MDFVTQAYADFIENRVQVDRDDLVAANLEDQWLDELSDERKLRIVDSYVSLLVERGLVTDDGTTTTWI